MTPMPPEERDAEMLGEIVSRYPGYPGPSYLYGGSNQEGVKVGRWHAEPVAQAMVEVVEAGVALRAANDDLMEREEEYPDDAYIEAWVRFTNALDAALGGGRNG